MGSEFNLGLDWLGDCRFVCNLIQFCENQFGNDFLTNLN